MTVTRATVDPPEAAELLRLVEEFLEKDLMPAQRDAKQRFRVRVAANLLRIARREAESLPGLETDRNGFAVPRGLIAVAGSLRELAEDLYHGRRSLIDPAVYALVTRHVEAKLRIAAPESLAESGAGS